MNRGGYSPAANEIAAAIRAGQNEHVVFLAGVPSVHGLAMQISALANRKGGVILVGVSDQPRGVVKYDHQHLGWVYEKAASTLKPGPNSTVHLEDTPLGRVGVVEVKPSAETVYTLIGPFVRDGLDTHQMSPEELTQRLPKAAGGQVDLSSVLNAMAENKVIVEGTQQEVVNLQGRVIELHEDLRYSQSVRGQWRSYLIGFLLGILASVIASYVFKYLELTFTIKTDPTSASPQQIGAPVNPADTPPAP